MQFKRGDTFDFSGPAQVTESGAAVTDFTGWTAQSQIRDMLGVLIADLEVTWLSRAPGVIRVRADDTTQWPETVLKTDIQFFAPDGSKVSTATHMLTIDQDITRPSDGGVTP